MTDRTEWRSGSVEQSRVGWSGGGAEQAEFRWSRMEWSGAVLRIHFMSAFLFLNSAKYIVPVFAER